jgi:hypothetical protein
VKRATLKKKYVAGALAAGLIMGAGGIAAAYFTATGTGTGKVNVGTATPFSVTQTAGSLSGKLYPGQSVTTTFKITNNGEGIEHYTLTSTDIVAAMSASGTVITAFQTTPSREVVPGCKGSWFTATVLSGSSNTLNPGASTTASVKVTMTNGTGSGSTQNACQTTFPKLDVAFGGPAGFALFEAEGGSAHWTGKTQATLTIPANAPAPNSTAIGAAAGIEVLKPGTALPTTAPTFKTSADHAGSPRWDIFFTTGELVVGYPSNGPAGANTKWAFTNGNSYVPWSTVLTHYAGKDVSQAIIVMTDTQLGTTDAITAVTYGGQHF